MFLFDFCPSKCGPCDIVSGRNIAMTSIAEISLKKEALYFYFLLFTLFNFNLTSEVLFPQHFKPLQFQSEISMNETFLKAAISRFGTPYPGLSQHS